MDAVLIGVLLNEPIDFLHLDNLSFHPGNFARCSLPAASHREVSGAGQQLLSLTRLYFERYWNSFRYQP